MICKYSILDISNNMFGLNKHGICFDVCFEHVYIYIYIYIYTLNKPIVVLNILYLGYHMTDCNAGAWDIGIIIRNNNNINKLTIRRRRRRIALPIAINDDSNVAPGTSAGPRSRAGSRCRRPRRSAPDLLYHIISYHLILYHSIA